MIETWSINRNQPLILWNKTMHAIVFAQVSLTVYYFSILKLSCFKNHNSLVVHSSQMILIDWQRQILILVRRTIEHLSEL